DIAPQLGSWHDRRRERVQPQTAAAVVGCRGHPRGDLGALATPIELINWIVAGVHCARRATSGHLFPSAPDRQLARQRAARAHRTLAPLHTPTPCAPAFLPPEPAFTSACALARHSDRADPAGNAASNAGALPMNRSCTSRPAGTPDLR